MAETRLKKWGAESYTATLYNIRALEGLIIAKNVKLSHSAYGFRSH